MVHELKIDPIYYCRVADGSKTFEVRRNDRGFQSGDVVHLMEYDVEAVNSIDSDIVRGYLDSPTLVFEIGYIYHLGGETVVFSLLSCKLKPAQKPKTPPKDKKKTTKTK